MFRLLRAELGPRQALSDRVLPPFCGCTAHAIVGGGVPVVLQLEDRPARKPIAHQRSEHETRWDQMYAPVLSSSADGGDYSPTASCPTSTHSTMTPLSASPSSSPGPSECPSGTAVSMCSTDVVSQPLTLRAVRARPRLDWAQTSAQERRTR